MIKIIIKSNNSRVRINDFTTYTALWVNPGAGSQEIWTLELEVEENIDNEITRTTPLSAILIFVKTKNARFANKIKII